MTKANEAVRAHATYKGGQVATASDPGLFSAFGHTLHDHFEMHAYIHTNVLTSHTRTFKESWQGK